ncbi:uncharacterized protein STAUR_5989 [Stigmatella aurantiaca DW4/3-1]|nr:uncharacterized protein STAUR_5989 [Stigmatella aurantiaca DW4/3-1]
MLAACQNAQPMLRGNSEAVRLKGGALPHESRQAPRESRTFEAVFVGTGSRNCAAEQIACFERCWNSKPPWPRKRGGAQHHNYCTEKCREEYMQCIKETEAQPLTFSDMKTAQDWLNRNKAEVLVGSIVLVAGAAFVIGTAGAGVLVLIPLAAL